MSGQKKKKYPWCDKLNICTDGDRVQAKELDSRLNRQQRRAFSKLYGIRTQDASGIYAWDVEEVLARMFR